MNFVPSVPAVILDKAVLIFQTVTRLFFSLFSCFFWITVILSALCGACWSFLATVDQSARQPVLCFWKIKLFVSYCQTIDKALRHIFVISTSDEDILDNFRKATPPATDKTTTKKVTECNESVLNEVKNYLKLINNNYSQQNFE